eukprot:135956-Lingulodinium_polyedra.AAC.1
MIDPDRFHRTCRQPPSELAPQGPCGKGHWATRTQGAGPALPGAWLRSLSWVLEEARGFQDHQHGIEHGRQHGGSNGLSEEVLDGVFVREVKDVVIEAHDTHHVRSQNGTVELER